MFNPFAIIMDIATWIVDVQNENEEIRRKELLDKKRKKEEIKVRQRQKEYELWKRITEEEHKNPDEFRVLPYGWSPFGLFL